MLFFQLRAHYAQNLVAIFQVQRAGGNSKTAGHRVYHLNLILLGRDICFEDSDHVPNLNNFTQKSDPHGKPAYTKRIIIYT